MKRIIVIALGIGLFAQVGQLNASKIDDANKLIKIVKSNKTADKKIALLKEALKTVDVNAQNKNGKTVLHWAVQKGDLPIVKYLIDHGADLTIEDKAGMTAHDIARGLEPYFLELRSYLELIENLEIDEENDPDLINFMAQADKYIDAREADELIDIVESEKTTEEKIKLLEKARKAGAHINTKNSVGKTVLGEAIRMGNFDIVKYLLEKGADIHLKDIYGETPLHRAAYENDFDIVKYLVESGANVNVQDKGGATPLREALMQGRKLDIVKYLVESGANVNVRDKNGKTMLHWARGLEMVKYFVESGVDVNAKDKNGKTARDLTDDPEIVSYLELAEDFYKVMNKKQTFDAFAQKHLMAQEGVVNKENLTYVVRLLHLGSKTLFDAFMTFIDKNAPTSFADGAEREYLLLDLALREGPRQTEWLREFFSALSEPRPSLETDTLTEREVKKQLEEYFKKGVNRLPQDKRDKIMKEKNKFEQQKKGFIAIPKKYLTGTMPAVTPQYSSEKVKDRLIDVTFKFED